MLNKGGKRLSISDSAAWGAIIIALIGVITSLGAVWWQIKKQWLLHSADMITSLVDRYNSESFEQRRLRFISMLLDHRDGKDITLIGNYGFGILGFFENIGHLVRRGALDKLMVWNKFGWEIIAYYNAITFRHDFIQEIRKHDHDETHYEEFEWLNNEMVNVFKKRGTKIYDDKGDVIWLDAFFKQESKLGKE